MLNHLKELRLFLSALGVVEKPIITEKTKKHLPKKKAEAPKEEEAAKAEEEVRKKLLKKLLKQK